MPPIAPPHASRTTRLTLRRYGIPEVWLIDIPARAIRIHRAPETGAYQTSFQLVSRIGAVPRCWAA